MSEKDNIHVAEEYGEALNAHDYAHISALHAKGFQFEGPDLPKPVDDAALQVYMQGAWTAFPDLTFQDTETIAQGDYVVVNWIATGTHKGPMVTPTGATFPATGRKVTYPGSETMEFKDGKIVREESHWDRMRLSAQLGLVPEV